MSNITARQYRKLFELLDQKGVDSEAFQRRLNSGVLADIFDPLAELSDRNALRAALQLDTLKPEIFRLEVDFRLSVKEMIAAGKFDKRRISDLFVEHNIVTGEEWDDCALKRFKGRKIESFEARYFTFNWRTNERDVHGLIGSTDKKNPWQPAMVEHVLAHAAKYPDEQRKYRIIALNPGGDHVHILGVEDARVIEKFYPVGPSYLDPEWRYLGVRRVK